MKLELFACGDMVNSKSNKNFVDVELKKIIKNSDISICNFEAPIKTTNMEPIPKSGPHLYQSKKSVEYLKEVGFNIVSMANNHIYDYGQNALEATISELKNYDIGYIGAGVDFNKTYTTKIIEKNGIKIGLIAGCENEFGCLYEEQNRGGYAWILHHKLEDNIRELKKEVDSIVLIAHAGVENIDFPIKEWRNIYKRFCDIGVDVVIGHHPHVPQGYEKYKHSLIFYSLGNFYFDTAGYENKNDDSYSVLLEFKKTSDFQRENSSNNINISFEIIYHKKLNGQTCKVNKEDVSFSLNKLNNLLREGYKKRNNDICLDLFQKYYYSYYENALGKVPKSANFTQIIKYIIKKIFKNRFTDKRNLLLLHNIRIESHRFVTQRALSLISEKNKISKINGK